MGWNPTSTPMVTAAWERCTTSWDLGVAERATRESRGAQPTLPFVTYPFLLWANITYYSVTGLLWLVMRRRKTGFKDVLRPVMIVYNAICVLLAGAVVVGIAHHKLFVDQGKFVCNEEHHTRRFSEDEQRNADNLTFYYWLFYIQKFWEFADTWFFILRRSFRQVTFLHLFHHSSITIVVGAILPHGYSGDMYMPIWLNAFVHVMMYSHYLVTALGVRSWWRQYLTSFQLLQFCLIATQSFIAWRSGPSCGIGDYGKMILIVYMGSMLVLFGNFFLNRYIYKSSKTGAPSKAAEKWGLRGVIKAVEPESSRTYGGTVVLDAQGCAEVALPEYFFSLNPAAQTELQYQLCPIGAAMPNVHVAREIGTGGAGGGGGQAGGQKGKEGLMAAVGKFHEAGCGLSGKDQQKGGGGKGMVAAPPSFAVGGGAPGKKVSWTVTAHRKAPAKQPPLFSGLCPKGKDKSA